MGMSDLCVCLVHIQNIPRKGSVLVAGSIYQTALIDGSMISRTLLTREYWLTDRERPPVTTGLE